MPLNLSSRRAANLQRALRIWFQANRRVYPWRQTRDPYAIWLSEVMLQQTRLAAALPAYERFLSALPTLEALAEAPQEKVLSLWSGLGYYSRARAFHAAAKQLHQRGVAAFPSTYNEARELPGVGAYTAAAVLSIAYGQAYAVVDANVVRVLSRLECLADAPQAEVYRTLARRLLDVGEPGNWNQALMELGQTLCLPKQPQCRRCPWQRSCRARREGVVDQFPVLPSRRARETVELEMTLAMDGSDQLLLERGVFPFLTHLWLPVVGRLPGALPVGSVRHAIVHRDFRVAVFAKPMSSRALQLLARQGRGQRQIVRRHELGQVGHSSLLTKALASLGPGLARCSEEKKPPRETDKTPQPCEISSSGANH